MNFRLGVDCDGVIFDFTSAYARMLEKVSGKTCTLTPGTEPHCWNWATEYGFDKGDDSKAWREIKKDPQFWATLAPKQEAAQAIAALNNIYRAGHEVYFITNRPGIAPHAQTIIALGLLGMEIPQVLVSEDKGPVAKGLKLTHFIDDKIENCEEVAQDAAPGCRVFCLTTNYNKNHEFNPKLNIIRVGTLLEFFTALAFEETNAVTQ